MEISGETNRPIEPMGIDYGRANTKSIRQSLAGPHNSKASNLFSYNPLLSSSNDIQKTYHNQNQLCVILSLLCFSTFYFGFTLTYLSTIKQQTWVEYFGEDAKNQSTIGVLIGVMPIGAAVGALIAPLIMKIFSRKNFVLLMNAIAIIIGGIIQINNLYVLLICRIIQGIVVGCNMAIIPIYIHELTPNALLGMFGVFTQLYVIVAVVVSYTFGVIFYFTNVDGGFVWRFMFSFTAFTCIVQSILLIANVIPESPVSLLDKGKEQQAKQIISRYNMPVVFEKVLADKVSQTQTIKAQRRQDEQKAPKKAIALGFQLPFMQQLSGINMIVTEISFILKSFNQDMAIVSPLIANIIQIIATGFSILLLAKMGRRPLILTGNLGLAICDLLMGSLFLIQYKLNWKPAIDIVLLIIFIFMVFYGLTIGPIVWLYVPEIIPANLVPPATAMNWIGCAFCIIVPSYIIQSSSGSPYSVFFMYGAVSIVFFIVNSIYLIETKGITRAQAMNKLR